MGGGGRTSGSERANKVDDEGETDDVKEGGGSGDGVVEEVELLNWGAKGLASAKWEEGQDEP